MWPDEYDDDHEYRLADAVQNSPPGGRRATLEALADGPLSLATLAEGVQGPESAESVSQILDALRQSGLIRTGLQDDLKTPTYELTRLGTRVLAELRQRRTRQSTPGRDA